MLELVEFNSIFGPAKGDNPTDMGVSELNTTTRWKLVTRLLAQFSRMLSPSMAPFNWIGKP
jgi:hypothetical protein